MGRFAKYSLSGEKKKPASEFDVSELEGLKALAESRGLDVKEKGPGLFRKSIDIISRPLYASAGFAKAFTQRDETGRLKENPLEEAWKGLSGQERETYSDVLKELGVENKWIRGGVGFALDVALDPATYFGGALIKGAAKTVGVGGKAVLGAGRKLNPQSVAALEMAGKSLKDAMGHAFVYGYGASKGISDDVARFFNKAGIAKEDIIKKNFKALNKFDDKIIRQATDIMFKNKAIEREVRMGLRKSSDIFKSPTKEVAEAVNTMKGIGTRIGKLTGIPEEQLYKNYIPSIMNLRDRALSNVKPPRGIKIGRQDYLKKFNNKIADEKLLKKPIEAYSRREFEVMRDFMAKGTMDDMISNYGLSAKEFNKLDDVAKALYKPIKHKGSKGTAGYLKEGDFNFVNNYMFPEMKSIDMLAKATKYDSFTRLFKTAVTAWFPAFHVRNYISGNVQNYSVLGAQAFNPKNHMNGLGFIKGTNKLFKSKGWTGTGKEMNKILRENFRGASRYIGDLTDYVDELADGSFKVKRAISNLNPRQIGNFVEMNQKAVAVSTALNQGKTLKDALKLAERAGFDYTKITQFESKVMRRLVPFYTFARKNAELQLRTAAKNPARILNQIKFTRGLSNVFGGEKPTEEDLAGLPPWALNSLGFKVEGNRFLTKFGLPMEEFIERVADPGKTTLSSLNPLVKFPLEAKLGHDFFREQKLVDINKIAPATGELLMSEKTPQWFRDVMNVQKVETDYGTKYYGSPKKLHLLRNIPTARFQNTLERMFDNDLNKVDKWLAFLTGARIYDIDVELQKYFKDRDMKRDIQDQLMQEGIGKELDIFYIPKPQK